MTNTHFIIINIHQTYSEYFWIWRIRKDVYGQICAEFIQRNRPVYSVISSVAMASLSTKNVCVKRAEGTEVYI